MPQSARLAVNCDTKNWCVPAASLGTNHLGFQRDYAGLLLDATTLHAPRVAAPIDIPALRHAAAHFSARVRGISARSSPYPHPYTTCRISAFDKRSAQAY